MEEDRTHSSGLDSMLPRRKPPKGRINICFVDTMTLTRDCLSLAMRAEAPDFAIDAIGSASEMRPEALPHVIILNIHRSRIDDDAVADSLRNLQLLHERTPIVILSDLADQNAALQAVALGIRGYVPTSVDMTKLVAAIRLVAAGGTYVSDEIVASFARQAIHTEIDDDENGVMFLGFTPREVEVIGKIEQGKINKTIAYELNISESTVKVHVRHIMKKLNAANRTQVAHLVRQLGGAALMALVGVTAW